MPAKKLVFHDRQVIERIADHVAPALTTGGRPLGYRISILTHDHKNDSFSESVLKDEKDAGRVNQAEKLFQEELKVLQQGPKKGLKNQSFSHYHQKITRGAITVSVGSTAEAGKFVVMRPVYSTRRQVEKSLAGLPSGRPLVPGWPSAKSSGLSLYVAENQFNRLLGEPVTEPRDPRKSLEKSSGLKALTTPIAYQALNDILFKYRQLTALIYTDEDDNVLGVEDISLRQIALCQKRHACRTSMSRTEMVLAAESFILGRDEAPEGATRVYFARSSAFINDIRPLVIDRVKTLQVRYEVVCVRRLPEEPRADRRPEASPEYLAALARLHTLVGTKMPGPVEGTLVTDLEFKTTGGRSSGSVVAKAAEL